MLPVNLYLDPFEECYIRKKSEDAFFIFYSFSCFMLHFASVAFTFIS